MHKATETTGTAAKRPMPGTFRFNLHRSDSGVYPPSGYRAICAAKPISRPDPSTGNRLPETRKHREPMIRSVFRGGQPTRHAKLIKDLKYSRRMTVSADKKRKRVAFLQLSDFQVVPPGIEPGTQGFSVQTTENHNSYTICILGFISKLSTYFG